VTIEHQAKVEPSSEFEWRGIVIDNKTDLPVYVGLEDGRFCSMGGTMHAWVIHAEMPKSRYTVHAYFEDPPSLVTDCA